MGDNDQPTGGPHFVGKKNELIEAKRSFRILEGREILIIYNEGVFHAMDAFCYREYSHIAQFSTYDHQKCVQSAR